jgi:GntR family transcriptional repressor for pyruvate dehydrogenase complex
MASTPEPPATTTRTAAATLAKLRQAVGDNGGLGAHRGSRSEGVAAYLDAFITREQIEPGTPLGTKPELANAFGVAPSTLNEALQILTSRERIKLRQGPRGGAFVAAPRPVLRLAHSLVQLTDGLEDVADAVELRDALEPTVTLNALTNRKPADLPRLHEHLDALEETENGTELYQAVLSLHAAIAECCTNELLGVAYLTALETVRSRAQTVIHENGDDTTPLQLRRRRLAVHRAIVEAIETQDEKALHLALRRHSTYRYKH